MDAAEIMRQLEDRFAGRLQMAARSKKRLYVTVQPDSLTEVVSWLHDQIEGFRLATSTGIDLRDGVGVFHHFTVNGEPLVITIKVMAGKPEPVVPSLAGMISAASWIEREIYEFLGVEFEGHPDLRRLLKARAFPDDLHPLRRDFDVQEFKEEIDGLPEL